MSRIFKSIKKGKKQIEKEQLLRNVLSRKVQNPLFFVGYIKTTINKK